MALVDLKTDLKSLKFGSAPAYDRPGKGLSGQPYIKEPFIDGDIVPQSEDFLLRGGLNAPLDAATDVARLTRYFADLKSPKGILFVAKENVLSRIGVRTQASGTGLNQGIYTPLSTITQATQGYLGGHVNKQGLNPFEGVTTYTDVKNVVIGEPNGDGNRLVDFYNNKITIQDSSTTLDSYSGGPNAPLGIGNTNINFATTNTGAPLRTSTGGRILGIGLPNNKSYTTFVPDQIKEFSRVLRDNRGSIIDFRKTILNSQEITPSLPDNDLKKSSTILSFAPSYNPANNKTIDGPSTSRIKYVSPGQRGNIISYTKGKIVQGKVSTVDKINALPIYSTKLKSEEGNDLVKFRIKAINNSNPSEGDYIHFRAFIDSFSDAYSANWNSQKYMGRAEPFYKYDSFTRQVNLSFTVAAQSKPEIMEMYRKLNYLVSNLAPEYTSAGYMAGSLVQLTMGGWCYELPGFINSLTLDVPQESPWEIGINEEGEPDSTVKEMPMICRVTGFSFTPIEKFVPSKQVGENGFYKRTGNQRYLALKAVNNNYDS